MGVFQAALPAVCAAALAASGVSARSLASTTKTTPSPPPATNPGDSIAKCAIDLSSTGFAKSAKAIAVVAAAEVSLAICDTGSASFGISEEAVAEAAATYAATAIAEASAACYSSGQSSFKVNGKSIATATATAYAAAFAEATASASVCNKCTSEAKVFASVFEEIIITAAAKAEIAISSTTGGPNQVVSVVDKVIKEGTIVAIANAVADARASAIDGCQTEVLIEGAAGDSKNPSTFFCNVQSNALDLSFKQDALIKAAATAAAAAGCYKSDSATAVVAAKELAIAAAVVLSEVVVACDVVGSGGACAFGANDINTTVSATAQVFATAFLNATSTCAKSLCQTDVVVMADAIQTVLASAASAAQADVCINGTNSIDIEVFELASNVSTITALANIIASASVEGGVCNISLKEIVASTSVSTDASTTKGVTIIINGVPQVLSSTKAPVVSPKASPPPVKTPPTPPPVKSPPPPPPVKSPPPPPPPVKTPPPPPACTGACVADAATCATPVTTAVPCCNPASVCLSIGGGAGVCTDLTKFKNFNPTVIPCGTH